jgi:hypothetical protein
MSNSPYPIIPASVNQSWMERHPYGKIVLGALVIAGLLVLFLCGLFGGIQYAFKHSDVYHTAMARAQSDPRVIEQVGDSIHAKWIWQGNINLENSDGNANMVVPIAGSRGEGDIHLVAKKHAGVWTFSQLEFEMKSGSESINLLPPASESP